MRILPIGLIIGVAILPYFGLCIPAISAETPARIRMPTKTGLVKPISQPFLSLGIPISGLQGPDFSRHLVDNRLHFAQLMREIDESEHRVGAFINAARNGDRPAVEKSLAEGMDINSKNRSGNTALMEACAGGHVEVVKLLMERGAKTDEQNNIGLTALRKALRNKHYGIVDLFVRKGLAKFDESVFFDLLWFAEVDYVKILIKKDPRMLQALHLACESGRTEIVRLFLENGADPNTPEGAPLSICCGKAPIEAVALLLDSGAKIESSQKHPPLVVATGSGRADVVELLLNKGADVNVRDEAGNTALHAACEKGPSMDPIVRLLLERGADVNSEGENGMTPLMVAGTAGRVEAMRMLLAKGADPNAKAQKGLTPLIAAATVGSLEGVRILLAQSAEVNGGDHDGATPLMWATLEGHLPVVKLLLENGANVNVSVKGRVTPLKVAIAKNHHEIAKLLRESGATE